MKLHRRFFVAQDPESASYYSHKPPLHILLEKDAAERIPSKKPQKSFQELRQEEEEHDRQKYVERQMRRKTRAFQGLDKTSYCRCCLKEFDAAVLRYCISYHAILRKRMEWGLLSTKVNLNTLPTSIPGVVYETARVCVFCSQFFDIDYVAEGDETREVTMLKLGSVDPGRRPATVPRGPTFRETRPVDSPEASKAAEPKAQSNHELKKQGQSVQQRHIGRIRMTKTARRRIAASHPADFVEANEQRSSPPAEPIRPPAHVECEKELRDLQRRMRKNRDAHLAHAKTQAGPSMKVTFGNIPMAPRLAHRKFFEL